MRADPSEEKAVSVPLHAVDDVLEERSLGRIVRVQILRVQCKGWPCSARLRTIGEESVASVSSAGVARSSRMKPKAHAAADRNQAESFFCAATHHKQASVTSVGRANTEAPERQLELVRGSAGQSSEGVRKIAVRSYPRFPLLNRLMGRAGLSLQLERAN